MFNKKLFYISFIYFFSGLPFGFFYTFIPVFFRTQGIDLKTIGLFSIAGLPWSLRLLFAPLIDRYFYKSFWMGISLIGISISITALSFFTPATLLFFLFLFFLTFFSTLFDTSADGFVVEWIPTKMLGKANGIRISAYRISLIIFGGGIVALSHYLDFKFIFYLLGIITFLAGFFLILNSFLKINPKKSYISLSSQFIEPLKEILKREKAFILLLFVLTYKIGDALLGAMVYPFWVDRGFTRLEIGLISGTLGSIFTIIGSLLGGFLTSIWSIKTSLLALGFFQSISNIGYAIASLPQLPKETVYFASIFESFSGGLGTAAFLTFLTSLCKKEFSSTQYAVFSTLFSLSLTFSRSLAGYGASYLGYTYFFLITFFISLPPFLLIFWIIKN
ncbi:MAG: putative arabinose efflux permease AraJ [Thermodesulfobacteria bacterium]|nr:MFS transporter [Thermodesulfobacteriota bacterium]MCU4138193.1 putative arabinose efflux permease AraJ [Thermodesulfobacteriota bacterium]